MEIDLTDLNAFLATARVRVPVDLPAPLRAFVDFIKSSAGSHRHAGSSLS
ncbi:MAG TPA: hypothetical protein VN325_35125 [Steroidobacteraceae bacterium]|nr:hypothetical protein [Steroidobacteraceae bacterium]